MKSTKQFLLLLAMVIIATSLYAQYRTEKVDRVFEVKGDEEFFLELDIDAGEVIVRQNTDKNKIAVSMRYTEGEFEHDM
ncbi:MAG: hypothetical protein ACE5I1_07305, partial [bacterium]